MKLVSTFLLMALLGARALAQSPSSAAKSARAEVDGGVTKDPGGEPVKKALIELIAENQAEGGDYTATTSADGTFQIEGILPGRYRLFAERTGLLDVDKHHARSEGRVLTLSAGQELKDLHLRLQAAAVVRGRVTDEDGEPLPDAQVAVLRQTYVAGHSRWEQVGAERTNDLGEYRIANLPAGNYFVSVNPPPDFKSLLAASGAGSEARKASEKPSTSYQTTYYPGTADRSQAAPIQLRAGDDFPVSFSLTPSPSLNIRGAVVNLPPGSTASVLLQSRDFSVVLNGADMRKDGTFVIHDVSPGSYTILATVDGGPTSLLARQSLQVGASDLEGLRLAPQAGSTIRGELRLESKGMVGKFDASQLFLTLRPADGGDDVLGMAQTAMGEGFAASAHVAGDGSFEWNNVPAGNYFVQFEGENGANGDWYLKSASSGRRDANESGISVNGGAVVLDLVVSANGGAVEGAVVDQKGEPVANAVVVAAPEARLRGRVERYRKMVSDQSGRFAMRGIPPGEYTIFAWESVDGEAYYNAEFLKGYEGQGSAVRVGEGERKSARVVVIPESGEQP